ncbi:MAG: FHA domain-containing protein [Thermoanaerobaculia bacterium]
MVPVRFPPGEVVLAPTLFQKDLFGRIDELLADGQCPQGRLELEAGRSRLTCLVHRSAPIMAGLLEGDLYSRVPLHEFAVRARQLGESQCSLIRTDNSQLLMAAVHFSRRPSLQASTELVDPAHVLAVLARKGEDAALAFERRGSRTLLFLSKGEPAHLFFGEPRDDLGSGTLEERILSFAFSSAAPDTKVEVFTNLHLQADPDAGKSFLELAQTAEPPPPVTVFIHLEDGEEVRQRNFTPPSMTIGRDLTGVDLFIDNLAVSRHHARLNWERGDFIIEDLGSSNGTKLNGTAITRAVVTPGDRVEIGKFVLTLVEHKIAPKAPDTMFMRVADVPTMKFFLTGEHGKTALGKIVLFGKAQSVDFQAVGFWVRPVHARIEQVAPTRHRLSCFGTARVKVNGLSVNTADLELEDEITIGRSRFRLIGEMDPGKRLSNKPQPATSGDAGVSSFDNKQLDT